jgi:predicted RNA binding protein YcfA (HicA-like mRNA interferase family)
LSKLPVPPAKKVIKALERFGFKIHRQSGSHIHMWNAERSLLVTVPNHPELARGTLRAIIRQAKLEKDEFLKEL